MAGIAQIEVRSISLSDFGLSVQSVWSISDSRSISLADLGLRSISLADLGFRSISLVDLGHRSISLADLGLRSITLADLGLSVQSVFLASQPRVQ